MTQEDIAALDALLPGRVESSESARAAHAGDKWFASALPHAVVHAESTEDVAAVMKFATERRIPVTPRGAGVGYVGGCVPLHGGIALSVMRMNRILEVAPEDGLIVTQPGVTTEAVQSAAKDRGWYYPPDPASLKECSIGGNVATNAGGPRCVKYGVTRPWVLGLVAVLPDGSVVRSGGRCHKNRQGFDLVGLFTGSEGMLGIITEITLRIIPHPPARALIGATFPRFADAAAAVQLILGSGFLPSALEISDKFTLQAARDYLGAGKLPPGEAHLFVETDGQPEAVQSEMEKLRVLLRQAGALDIAAAVTEEEVERLWSLRREFSYSLRATGLTKLNEDIVVPRSKLVDLVSFAETLQAKTGFPVACFGHAGDGNIHVNVMVPDMNDPVQKAASEEALDLLFNEVLRLGGVISGEHGIGIAKKRWFPKAVDEAGRALHRTLKQALDPLGILNPGKFLD